MEENEKIMGVSGCFQAVCKECSCKLHWHLDDVPFVDSEIVGTCESCANNESHDCVDEFSIMDDGGFEKVGEKTFKVEG